MAAILTRQRRLKLMIVSLGHDPGLVRDPRGVGANRVIVADAIDDSLFLANVLAQDVTENAALAVAVPLARGAELVKNPARHKSGRGELGMGVLPFLTSLGALILEGSH